jgi:citron Rho-interacting kinase
LQKAAKLESDLTVKTQECSDLWKANNALTAALAEQEKEKGNLQDINDKLTAVLESRKSQLETHEETIGALQEKCSLLGTQVEELEVAVDEYNEKEEHLITSNESLKSQIESLEQQLAASKQQHSYEKAARQRADERVSKASDLLKEAEEAHGEEVSALQEKIAQLLAEVETLSQKLQEAERAHAVSEVNVKCLEDRLEAADREYEQLRRSLSKSNKEVGFAKATSLKLNKELGLLRQELDSITKERDDLASQLSALSVSHNDEKIRMQTTQAQQAKLISLLQSDNTATKSSWKKKMARTPNKVSKRSRDLIAQKEDWKQLQEAVWQDELKKTAHNPPSIRTSPPPESTFGKNATNCTSVETVESGQVHLTVSTLALTALQESPGNQPSPRVALPSTPSDFDAGNYDLKPKPAGTRMRERMHHNIPHRFVTTRAMKSTKCASCHSTVHFGKAAKCTHCKVICHLKCASSLPATCGLPSALVDHYVTESMKTATSSPLVASPRSTDKMQGWIKVLRYNGTKHAWEQQWAVLGDISLMLYKEKPQKSECDANEVLQLTNATLQPSVSCLDLPDVAKTDIPFIFSITLPQPTRCWPTQTIYCLSDSKQLWIQSLQGMLKTSTVDKSSLKSLVSLENSVTLDVNCCLYLNDKILLLGAGEGLFVLHMSSLPKSGHITKKTIQSSQVLQQIPGVGNIQQMERIPESDFIVMIAGGDGELISVRETDVKSLSYSTGSPPPDMSFNKILDTVSCSSFCSGNVEGEVYLCAAVSGKVRLLKCRPDNRGFRLIKVLSHHLS